MSQHLQRITGIFAREFVTIDYIKSIGVTENIYLVADPAFIMDPVKLKGIEDMLSLDEETIGINFSPLMAKYVTGGDIEAWTRRATLIIDTVAQATELPIYLVPHVTNPGSNDHEFMQRALSHTKDQNGTTTLVPPDYNATEMKWIISQMTLFAGARMHSMIAALSTDVPTLSFPYSIKARGINRDIFGHTDYCIEPADLDAGAVAGWVTSMLDEGAAIRNDLEKRIPGVQGAVLSAGAELKRVIGVN